MVTREPEEGSPSFFKVIRYPSAAHLSLPNAFVRRYINKIPKNPTLVTATGNHSWKMEFVKIGENYCFAHGWEELVKDVGLCIRDVLVFWLIDPVTFQVSFLGENGCEKYVPVNKKKTKTKTKDDDDGDVIKGDDDGKDDLCFQKEFGWRSCRYYMSLPIKFVRAAGLEHKQSIKLKDHEGKEWIIGISVQRYTGTKYGLSSGWAIFRKYHNFSHGDVLTFGYDKQEGTLNLTNLYKSKKSIVNETSMEEVNRNMGTQSYYGDGNVKIEDECSPTEKPCDVGSVGVKVKIEDGWVSETVVGKRKRETPLPEKPSRGGGDPALENMFVSKRVIYF